MNQTKLDFVYAGEICPDGEIIKVGAAVGDSNGRSIQRNEQGIYLLSHGQQFSLRFTNHIAHREVSMTITGDDDSTTIADGLILGSNQRNCVLKRWVSVDQAFMAYRRESAEGDAVGEQSIAAGGGGLIKILFTIGEYRPVRSGPEADPTRGATRGGLHDESFVERGGVEEGVMGAGGKTGQRFQQVTFHEDPNMSQFEIHLRWGIAEPVAPTAPPDRVGNHRKKHRNVVSAPTIK